ncbi:hypothetical protein [Polaromonas eurypsychrophila]|uniref:DUF4148 domain-containing protein n=1 Tax=Polaromonas eurypsychrophila TaxID=1614635 RepID=A0A916SC69_9BURK|nr:hypothetical protein [Polaromonas eurypsychrophila]GGA93830.1 hypothetical protein GCM10011496_13600 [Polaromonas eurypsychrophila]
MNTKFIASALFAAASFASVSAFAAGADGGVDTPSFNTVSATSRAAVHADALATRVGPVTASSQVDGGRVLAATPAASERNRADVRAEAVQARMQSAFSFAPGRA